MTFYKSTSVHEIGPRMHQKLTFRCRSSFLQPQPGSQFNFPTRVSFLRMETHPDDADAHAHDGDERGRHDHENSWSRPEMKNQLEVVEVN